VSALLEIVEVSDDILQFCSLARGWPSSCNVYLIRDGAESWLIDAGLGVDPSLAALLEGIHGALGRWGQQIGDLSTILLTHTHTDHAGGTMPIAKASGARVMLPARGWLQAADPWWQVHHIMPPAVQETLTVNREFDIAAHFHAQTMPELFTTDCGIEWRLIEDDDEFAVGQYRFRAWHMPGHDVAHLAYIDARRGVAFTGDLLTALGTSLPWYPPNAGGVTGYVQTLDRIETLSIDTLCPGHHMVIRGAAAVTDLIRTTRRMICERDARLVEAVADAPRSFAELDDVIYDVTVRQVIPWASSVTMAHINHLEQVGVLSRRADGRYVSDKAVGDRYLRRLAEEGET